MVFTTWLTARALNGASLEAQHYSLSATVLRVHSFAHYFNIRSHFPICGLPIHSEVFISFPSLHPCRKTLNFSRLLSGM